MIFKVPIKQNPSPSTVRNILIYQQLFIAFKNARHSYKKESPVSEGSQCIGGTPPQNGAGGGT